MTFEQASKELEEIVSKLEAGTTLDEGITLFEKGVELSKFCSSELDKAKGKITVIRESLDKFMEEDLK